MIAGTLIAPGLGLKQAIGHQLSRGRVAKVTLEDMQESEFAEHRIPVEEKPFWTGDGAPISNVDPVYRPRSPARSLPVPLLVTTIDAEEDFDWNRPCIRTSSRVTSMRSQYKAHRVFERYGVIRPIWSISRWRRRMRGAAR